MSRREMGGRPVVAFFFKLHEWESETGLDVLTNSQNYNAGKCRGFNKENFHFHPDYDGSQHRDDGSRKAEAISHGPVSGEVEIK